MENKIEVYKNQAMDIYEQVETMEVKTNEDAQEATTIAKQVKEIRLLVEKEKDAYVKPAKEIQNKAKAVYDPVIDVCKNLERTIVAKASQFILAQRKAVEEKQQKIADSVQSGRIKEETALRQMEKIPDVKKSVQGENGQIRVSEYEDIEIQNENLIPRNYLVPDTAKIRKAVLGGVDVPGVIKVKKVKNSLY
jgi:transcriptional regulator of heat shock response